MKVNHAHLTLFFTRGISLQKWEKAGLLERELAVYRRLLSHLKGINLVTYGDERELAYLDQLDGIQILCNRWKLPTYLYALLIPFLFKNQLIGTDLIKTNQMRGAESAAIAARLYSKPLLARSGYVWSERDRSNAAVGNWRTIRQALLVEGFVYRRAARAVVPTPYLKSYISETHRLDQGKVAVVPNYVDAERFVPQPSKHDENGKLKLIFVGRFVPQKNLINLLYALKGLDVALTLVGDGVLRQELEGIAEREQLDVTFTGKIPGEEIPAVLNRAHVYISPSEWEGHPKALIEGMACGLAAIGSDAPGNRDTIVHEASGLICQTDPESIRAAIQSLIEDRALVERLGKNGREQVLREYSLDAVLQKELALYRRVLNKKLDLEE
ncbi:MAG: glycosyltransferase family 4 protein [Chloroflexota bacterium]